MDMMKKTIRYSLCAFLFAILSVGNAYSESWREGKILLAGESLELYLMDADGSNFTKLCDLHIISTKGYSLSPDCQKVLFTDGVVDNDLLGDIYIMDISRLNKTNLTNTDEINEYSPCWSPNGKQIAYAKSIGGKTLICVMNLFPRSVKELHEGRSPDWSSKGDILFYFDGNIWKMNADGSNLTNLTKNKLFGNPLYIRWSPDGNKIVFRINNDNNNIYIMDENGDNLRNLINSDFPMGSPCWSPNGEKVAFVLKGEDRECHLYIVNSDGSNVERLINDDTLYDKIKCIRIQDWRSSSYFAVEMAVLSKAITWGQIKD